MNKKQGVIIVVLLALIVTTGILATRLNNPLTFGENDKSGKSIVSFNNNEKTTSSANFFTEANIERKQKRNIATENLKSLIDNKNTSKETKADAEKKYLALTMSTEYESKVELALKAKGYDEAICMIDENKAKVIVKSNEKLTDKQAREIKNEVMRIAKISDVEIESKQ